MKAGQKYKLKDKIIEGLNEIANRPQVYIVLINYLGNDLWAVDKHMKDKTIVRHTYSGDYIYTYYELIEEA